MYGEAIWSCGKRIAAVFNSLRNNIRKEVEYQIIKWTLLKELPLHNPGGRVTGMEDRELIYLAKPFVISPLRMRDLDEKEMG